MSTNDPNWSDDGFDSLNDGFLSQQPKPQEPVSSYQAPVPPPPSASARTSSAPRRAVLFLLLFFITAVGLVITWVARGPEERGGNAVVVPPKGNSSPAPEVVERKESAPIDIPPQSAAREDVKNTTIAPVAPKSAKITSAPIAKPVEVAKVDQAPDVAANESKPEPAVIEKKPDMPKAEKRQQPTTRSSANNGQEWCVQVFASTNADDADEWNARLRTKNVYDSRIEIVDRQGQTWYRVRFGRYSSRQEAEQTALSMGFRNAWVNRTR